MNFLSQQGHIIFRRIIGEIYRLMDTAPALKVPEMEELKIFLERKKIETEALKKIIDKLNIEEDQTTTLQTQGRMVRAIFQR